MTGRVLGLDVGPINDRTTVAKFSSNHPCNGYDVVLWNMSAGTRASESEIGRRSNDFGDYLESGGRLIVLGVLRAVGGPRLATLQKIFPLVRRSPISADLLEAQGLGAQGTALLNGQPKHWRPRVYFDDLAADDQATTSIDLMTIVNTADPVARAIKVGSGWLFLLPGLTSAEPVVLDHVVGWALNFSLEPPKQEAPDWVAAISLADESAQRTELADLDDKIVALNTERARGAESVEHLSRWKALVYATGEELEAIVRSAFEVLGFQNLMTEKGRADLRLELGERRIVVETKGKERSAAEKDAAQLEKWVSSEITAGETDARGILVVNGWRRTSLPERNEAVFPDQMMKYSEDRGHCLVSGVQLLGIVNTVLRDPTQASIYAQKLIDTVGRLPDFEDPTLLISGPPPATTNSEPPSSG